MINTFENWMWVRELKAVKTDDGGQVVIVFTIKETNYLMLSFFILRLGAAIISFLTALFALFLA